MEKIKLWLAGFIILLSFNSCSDEVTEVRQEGSPTIKIESAFENAHFGDMLPFTVNVSDNIALSVLNVSLYFGEEEVSSTNIRTKENGRYNGEIAIPFLKDIPDGTATLEFSLRNITMKTAVKSVDLPISRVRYPYLILVTESDSYPMTPTNNQYEYAITEAFPSTELSAYIKTPTVDEKGSEIVFGWESGQITNGTNELIPFVSPVGGAYTVSFNIKNFQGAPFFEILLNDHHFKMIDKETYSIDLNLSQGDELTIEGLVDLEEWWIDLDYLEEKSTGNYKFTAISGKYRIYADLKYKYFRLEVLDGTEPAELNDDGSGALWIIGQGIGKPSVEDREIGWDTSKAICMAPVESKVYQVTLVANETIKHDFIDFKFFHQKGWGGEFDSSALSTDSDIIFVGDGDNGRDNGNLGLVEGKELKEGSTYVFTVDVSAGIEQAILKVVEK